jgi:chemotaxis signal transduction protein
MKTRMQPIGNAWANLPRLIRDLSLDLGKKVELRMIGAETELDRQVLELIKDPLTHMVRNSVDHGIELPEERRRAGKRKTGEVVLNAYHEGGHIIIEIGDDGWGINLEAIKNKAIENGMASAAEVEAMSDQQALQLIFKPGLTTATEVTNVSGRGVGMAIVSVLIVECGGERFAIPQISVVELVRVSAHSEHTIEMINNAPVLRLRDRLLPLDSLSQILKLGNGDATVSTDDDIFIVVSQVGAQSFGIIIDKVFDTEEIVVKPVAPMLRDIGVFSGNTILGDGSIVMILDPNGIAATATHTSMTSDSGTALGAPVPARRNAAISLRALTAGASDYIPKPTSARDLHATDGFRRELLAKVEALGDPAARRERRSAAPLKGPRLNLYRDAQIVLRRPSTHPSRVVAVGSSTGGARALFTVFQTLGSKLRVPVLITQHMPPTFTAILAEHIQRVTGVACAEAREDEDRRAHLGRAQPAQHLVAVDVGQHQIENDDVVVVELADLEPVLASGGVARLGSEICRTFTEP